MRHRATALSLCAITALLVSCSSGSNSNNTPSAASDPSSTSTRSDSDKMENEASKKNKPNPTLGAQATQEKANPAGKDGQEFRSVAASEFRVGNAGSRAFIVNNLQLYCLDQSEAQSRTSQHTFVCSPLEKQLKGLIPQPGNGGEALKANEISLAPGPNGIFWQARNTPVPGPTESPSKLRELKSGERAKLGDVTCTMTDDALECTAAAGRAGSHPNGAASSIRITSRDVFVDGCALPLGGTCSTLQDPRGQKVELQLSRGGNNCGDMEGIVQDYLSSTEYVKNEAKELPNGFRCTPEAPSIAALRNIPGSCVEKDNAGYREFTYHVK